MKRPLPLNSQGMADYHRWMRSRQERDERLLQDHGKNPEVPFPYAYTAATAQVLGGTVASGGGIDVQWTLGRVEAFQVEPIMFDPDSGHVQPQESGIYVATADLSFTFGTPASPDEVFQLRCTLDVGEVHANERAEVEAMGNGSGQVVDLNIETPGVMGAGDTVGVYLYPTLRLTGDDVSYDLEAALHVWWYAPATPAPPSES